MPVLVESEEEEDEDSDCKDPLPEKLQSSMVRRILLKREVKTQSEHNERKLQHR